MTPACRGRSFVMPVIRASSEKGPWLIVGSGNVRAVAQVAQIEGDLVWVRPLPGPVSKYRLLLGERGTA